MAQVYERFGVPDERGFAEIENAPVVYAIRAIGHGVKIGHSRNVTKRISAIATHCPHRVVLLGTFRGGLEYERQLHIRFEHERLRGEWFSERIIGELLELLLEEGELIAA